MNKSSIPNGRPSPMRAPEVLDMYFLEIRSHLLEAAAGLDRVERAEGGEEALRDPRVGKILKALRIMGEQGGERAQRFLELFSEPAA